MDDRTRWLAGDNDIAVSNGDAERGQIADVALLMNPAGVQVAAHLEEHRTAGYVL